MTDEVNYCPNCGEGGRTDYCTNCGENLTQYSQARGPTSAAQGVSTQQSSSTANTSLRSTPSEANARDAYHPPAERNRKSGKQRSVASESSPTTRTTDNSQQLGQLTGLLSSVVMIVGVFIPWLSASVLTVDLGSVSGSELVTGKLILAFGAVMVVSFVSELIISHPGISIFQIVSGPLSLIVAGLTLVFITDPLIIEQGTLFASDQSIQNQITRSVLEIHTGAYVTLLGSLGALTGALISLIFPR